MNTVNREIARVILRTLTEYARGVPGDLQDQTVQLLQSLSPIEMENIVEPCTRHFRIDFPSVGKEIIRHRNESLIVELVRAGASNSLLRNIFGVNPRQLTRIRGIVGKTRSDRRRLTGDEVAQVRKRVEEMPALDQSQLAVAVLCLDVSRNLELPFMPVYRQVTGNPAHSHDQG